MTPPYITDIAAAILARDLVLLTSSVIEFRGASPEADDVKAKAYQVLQAPVSNWDLEMAPRFYAYGWAAFGAIRTLGWRRP